MKSKGQTNLLIFGVLLLVTWLVLRAVFPVVSSVSAAGTVGILAAALIAAGVLSVLKVVKIINVVPFPVTSVMAIALLGGGLLLGGLIPGISLPGATITPSAPVATVSPVGTTATSCLASVSDEIKGTSATLTLNGYNLAVDSPYASAADSGTAYIFKSDKLTDGTAATFVSSGSDTTAGSVTGVKVGEVVSVGGGNASFVIEPVDGLCINGQQVAVVLKSHGVQAISSMDSTNYDSTGSTELGTGTESIMYTAAMGASEESVYFHRIKNNGANGDFWLGAVGLATFTNISDAFPGGASAGLFVKVGTPLFLKDAIINTSYTSPGTAGTMTRSYTPYKLNSPVLLTEFQEFKYQYNVKSTTADPVGAVNTTAWSGVAGIGLDMCWVRGTDGKMYFDFWDHTATEGNCGATEGIRYPNDDNTGFQQTIS